MGIQGDKTMLLRYSIANFMTFDEPVEVDFEADQRIGRLKTNLLDFGERKYLKTVGFFGPNNSGKTALLKALDALRKIMLGQTIDLDPTLLLNHNRLKKGDSVIRFEVSFSRGERRYDYAFGYDPTLPGHMVYEQLVQKGVDGALDIYSHGLGKAPKSDVDRFLPKMVDALTITQPLILMVGGKKNEALDVVRKDFVAFAQSFYLFSPNAISRDEGLRITAELLKEGGEAAKQITGFVKGADVHLDDLSLDPSLAKSERFNPLVLRTTYDGFSSPSVMADSVGTIKIEALAGLVYRALKEGGVLVVDELDSSLFFALSRSIVSLFNNVANTSAQLLFSSHDLNLLDTRKLLRKEQIVFVTRKAHESPKLVPLSSFTAAENGVRSIDDIEKKYIENVLVDLPNPSLIDLLLSINDDKKASHG